MCHYLLEGQESVDIGPIKVFEGKNKNQNWGCWEIEGCLLRGRWTSCHKNGIHFNTNTIEIIDKAPIDPKVEFHNRCIKDAKHQSKYSYPPVKNRPSCTFSL